MHDSKIDVGATLQRQRGFSMAEVLVAIAMLSVILLAVFGLVTAGVARAYGGKKMTEASALAESIMERVNVPAAHLLLDGTDADDEVTKVWEKTANNSIDASVTDAAEATDTPQKIERNKWRAQLRDSSLPSSTAAKSSLTVTVKAMPPGATFGDADVVLIIVDVKWAEFATRSRHVRLQTFNLRERSY